MELCNDPIDLSAEQLELWHERGYIVVEKLFSEKQIDLMLLAIYRTFCHIAPEYADFDCDGPPHHSDEFHAALTTIRTERPELFSRIYDFMQSNALVNGMVACYPTLHILGQVFNDPPETIVRADTVMRMDPPQDRRNLVSWHQDRNGRPHNDSGDNALVFLMMLQDTNASNGGIYVCDGSHKEGFIDVPMVDAGDQYASQIYTLPEECLAKYTPYQIDVKAGDGVFVNYNLIHASGVNHSNRVRFSAGMRFHRSMADDFHPGTLIYDQKD